MSLHVCHSTQCSHPPCVQSGLSSCTTVGVPPTGARRSDVCLGSCCTESSRSCRCTEASRSAVSRSSDGRGVRVKCEEHIRGSGEGGREGQGKVDGEREIEVGDGRWVELIGGW